MTVIAWAGAGWVLAIGWILALARAAALAGREDAEPGQPLRAQHPAFGGGGLAPAAAPVGEASGSERRVTAGDRRSARRPWGATSAGRRGTDGLEADVAAAQRALHKAEARLEAARAQTG